MFSFEGTWYKLKIENGKLKIKEARMLANNFQLKRSAPLAQLVEQLTLNQWVPGSSP